MEVKPLRWCHRILNIWAVEMPFHCWRVFLSLLRVTGSLHIACTKLWLYFKISFDLFVCLLLQTVAKRIFFFASDVLSNQIPQTISALQIQYFVILLKYQIVVGIKAFNLQVNIMRFGRDTNPNNKKMYGKQGNNINKLPKTKYCETDLELVISCRGDIFSVATRDVFPNWVGSPQQIRLLFVTFQYFMRTVKCSIHP